MFVGFLVGQAILSSKNIGVSLGDPNVFRAVLGAGLAGVGWYQYQLYRKNEDLTDSLQMANGEQDVAVKSVDNLVSWDA